MLILGSGAAGGMLNVATLEAFDDAQGEGMTLNSRSSQQRTQVLATF